MTGEISRNPAYAGLQPHLLEVTCHDRSPVLEVRCTCGADSHVHETQIKRLLADEQIGVRCPECQEVMTIGVKDLRGAFAYMRASGWTT